MAPVKDTLRTTPKPHRPPTPAMLKRWRRTAQIIREKSTRLMTEMMNREPEVTMDMELSDWADNITCHADDLIHEIDRKLRRDS